MYCISAVVRSGGSRYKDDGPRLKKRTVMQETARPFEADGRGTARNAVRATGRSGACGVVLLLYPGDKARDTARIEQENRGRRKPPPASRDNTNETDTWRQTE